MAWLTISTRQSKSFALFHLTNSRPLPPQSASSSTLSLTASIMAGETRKARRDKQRAHRDQRAAGPDNNRSAHTDDNWFSPSSDLILPLATNVAAISSAIGVPDASGSLSSSTEPSLVARKVDVTIYTWQGSNNALDIYESRASYDPSYFLVDPDSDQLADLTESDAGALATVETSNGVESLLKIPRELQIMIFEVRSLKIPYKPRCSPALIGRC